ncbi:cell division protein ZapE [Candidatus Berkiella aquae]|uniref:AFG1 family ATPase n=1 Tax=Candidatus Berkiella aquae TaxID=295108 RepID=A0A0Q9YJ60_9GAMM|nr:cell division protein ZapE [Candidatus Berkiella aquae]MCS5710742.1 AFG1 family ATPase [Candidatus Berkiella aquae]
MMTPLAWYEAKIQSGKLVSDPFQHKIVLQFDQLYKALLAKQRLWPRIKNHFYRLFKLEQEPTKGIYLWGSVGRGKTFLMDAFFHLLPFQQKERYHFHRFMQHVHEMLKKYQGKSEPLYLVAKAFKARTSIICFDEFYVNDIVDAMILSELFRHLFALGITLVATSNIKPDDLYPNGLQREKFLPAISLIKQHTQIISMDGSTDYRMQYLSNAQLYQYPADALSEKKLMMHFQQLASEKVVQGQSLTILERKIPTQWLADNIVWFKFSDLCIGPRSAMDYIQIASEFQTVIVSGVMTLTEENEDIARRFIALVDEFYDHKVTLILSATVPLSALYQGRRYRTDFQRTISRLTEMQSLDYLRKEHIP